MSIAIQARLKPFVHSFGASIPLPKTHWEVKIFPARLLFTHLPSGEVEEVLLPIVGPVDPFTVLVDLHKGRVEVFGQSQRGFFRYFLEGGKVVFSKGGEILLPFLKVVEGVRFSEFLFMGVHKAPDWDLVMRRKNLAEIFPFWIALSQWIPEEKKEYPLVGNYHLLKDPKEYRTLLSTGFAGILSPRLRDELYQGILPEEAIPPAISPLGLLLEGGKKIRALFFEEEGDLVQILPRLPKEFHAGKYLSLKTKFGDLIDLEWSKKTIRRMAITPGKSREMSLGFSREVRSCRFLGSRVSTEAPFPVQTGKKYTFDRFEK